MLLKALKFLMLFLCLTLVFVLNEYFFMAFDYAFNCNSLSTQTHSLT